MALGQVDEVCPRKPIGAVDKIPPLKDVSRSYLTVRNAPGFHAEPLILKHTVGDKRLTVIGTRHISNAKSPMYRLITVALDAARPELILHEGDAPPGLGLETASQAIRRAADLGFIAHYASQHGIVFRSADVPINTEIAALLADHATRDVFVFLTAQRLVGSASHPDLSATAAAYPTFLGDYLQRNGLPIDPSWRKWKGFVSAYEALTGRPLASSTWSGRQFDPTVNGGPLNELARASDRIRDQSLLTAIRHGWHEYSRVAVQFGVYHVLAIEPILDNMVSRFAVTQDCAQ